MTRLILAVISVSVVCWSPYWVSHILLLAGRPVPRPTFLAANLLLYTNSAVNPLLYGFLSDQFRKGRLKLILGLQASYLFVWLVSFSFACIL